MLDVSAVTNGGIVALSVKATAIILDKVRIKVQLSILVANVKYLFRI